MNNLRDIKSRLRSLRKNEQILRAMKMVSAVKLRRVQMVVQGSRPYAEGLETLFQDLLEQPDVRALQHAFLASRPVKRILWVVLSTDSGLCGSLNANLFRYIQKALQERNGRETGEVSLMLIGRKAGDFFKRMHVKPSAGFRIEQAYPLVEAQADVLARQLCAWYLKGQFDNVEVLYARCKSQLQQIPTRVLLLPIVAVERPSAGGIKYERLFEPQPAAMLGDLAPSYIASRIRQLLLAEQVSEHSARMFMMDQASKNASDMIGEIQLDLNKLRQFMITRELADITTGVEAMS
ncbi:MAG: ATP synthase F1 subunit gamma [Kiritimatiellae bacterium]|nr:ATP synthase F1 subunit gamma [Kiritimatiellia bacterium]